jgi:hypothetical protein
MQLVSNSHIISTFSRVKIVDIASQTLQHNYTNGDIEKTTISDYLKIIYNVLDKKENDYLFSDKAKNPKNDILGIFLVWKSILNILLSCL